MLRDQIIGAKYRASSGTPVNLTMADVTDVNDLQFIDSDILPAKHTLNIIEDRVARPATADSRGTVKIGSGIAVDEEGTISADYPEQIVLDTYTYGVSWNTFVADPIITKVGNQEYHRTLPIQSKMKGCIAQMKGGWKIMYYLDPDDWRWREKENAKENILTSQTLVVTDGVYTLTNNIFGDLRYELQWVKINNIACKVASIDTTTKTATLTPDSTIEAGTYDVQMGAVLNGYDGEVMVDIPEFWIKSWDSNPMKEVRIAPAKFSKLDDTWEHQPAILVAAYRDTVLNTVPANMGYLSTLEANSMLSVCNTHDYCRGGNNNATYDTYLSTDANRTMLGKPRTSLSRATMRTYARKSGKELMSYLQYKRIMYWLYVIEYGNFNSQASYVDGQGLGDGVSNVNYVYWGYYNASTALVPCGYTNSLGNGTGVVATTFNMPTTSGGDPATTVTSYVPRWRGIEQPFGDVLTNTDGAIIVGSTKTEGTIKYNSVYATDNPELYSDSDYESMKFVGYEIQQSGMICEFNLGDTAEIIPIRQGGGNTTYKCDYYWAGGSGLFAPFFGGNAGSGAACGLGCFYSGWGVGAALGYFGFRSSCVKK